MRHRLSSKVIRPDPRSILLFAVMAGFSIAGIFSLLLSHAATSTISLEPETGTITLGAAAITDTAASGGRAVKFSPAPSSTPPPNALLPNGPTGTWTLTFDDEFNGTSLDSSKWDANWFNEGGNMNNVGTYASNVSVANGTANLQLSSSTRGALIHTGYGSGRYQIPLGSYVEARILFPGSGTTIDNWPAWWANSTNNYPASGENDIAEGLGTLTVNYHSTSGAHNMGTVAGTWSNAFHTYGLYRQAGKSDVYWDGKLVKSYTTDDDGKPEDLIFNVGSGEGPTITGAAGAMQIDYVRAWKLN